MSELEKDIEDKVCKWAAAKGFICLKIKFVETGWPDRLFISPQGHTIFIEFKRRGERPTKLQEYRINELGSRGIPATWHDTYVGAITTLKAALESTPLPDASNQVDAESGVSGAVSGSRTGKDFHGLSVVQNTEGERIREEDADSSASSSGVQSLARRDKEVGGLPGTDIHDSTRDEQDPESDS